MLMASCGCGEMAARATAFAGRCEFRPAYPSGAGRLVGLRFGPEAAQLETSLAAVLALLHGPDDLDERA
jgi:hypothetical protein